MNPQKIKKKNNLKHKNNVNRSETNNYLKKKLNVSLAYRFGQALVDC